MSIASRAPTAVLKPFESRILHLRMQGMQRNEIARLLHRSPQTISNSLTIAKEKLGAKTLIEAALLLAASDDLGVTAPLDRLP